MEEFQDFQLASKDEFPCLDLNVEIFWSKMSDLKLAFGSSKRFPNLCNLAKGCLVLPVSNAEVERVFSLLKKIQTEFRSDLGSDIINSLICCKQNTDFTCVNFIPVHVHC